MLEPVLETNKYLIEISVTNHDLRLKVRIPPVNWEYTPLGAYLSQRVVQKYGGMCLACLCKDYSETPEMGVDVQHTFNMHIYINVFGNVRRIV